MFILFFIFQTTLGKKAIMIINHSIEKFTTLQSRLCAGRGWFWQSRVDLFTKTTCVLDFISLCFLTIIISGDGLITTL